MKKIGKLQKKRTDAITVMLKDERYSVEDIKGLITDHVQWRIFFYDGEELNGELILS